MYPQDPTQAPPPAAPAQPTLPTEPPVKEKHAIHNPLSVMQPGEQMICEIKRHPIGMLGIYVGAGFLMIVLALVIFGVAPSVINTVSRGEVIGIGSLIFFVAAALCFGFVAISNKVYWGNSWVLTTDSLTQVTQTSLFHKQSSQLSLGNLEDVTADQAGPLAHMFNFGVLRVETAGERSKFMFLYCPKPNEYAQQILSARERFEQGRSGDNPQSLYRGPGTYPQPNEQPAAPSYAAPPNPAGTPGYAPAPQPAAGQTYGLPQYQTPAPGSAPQAYPTDPLATPAAQPQGYQFPAPSDDTPGVNVGTQS